MEATNDYVRVETVIGVDYIKYEDTEGPGPWTEVNILEFLYSVMIKRSLDLVSSGTINVIASPDLELCFQVDDIFTTETSLKPLKMRFESGRTSTRNTDNLANFTYLHVECGIRNKSK